MLREGGKKLFDVQFRVFRVKKKTMSNPSSSSTKKIEEQVFFVLVLLKAKWVPECVWDCALPSGPSTGKGTPVLPHSLPSPRPVRLPNQSR